MNKLLAALLLPALLIAALPARASDEPYGSPESIDASIRYDREETEAYLWSAGGLVLPLAAAFAIGSMENGEDYALPIGLLGVGAVTVGPSVGQFKAGAVGHGVAATALRAGGEFIAFAAIMSSLCIMCDSEEAAAKPSPVGGMLVGAGMYLAGTIYSLGNIHATYDAKREAASTASTLRIAPTLALDRENRLRPGAALALTF